MTDRVRGFLLGEVTDVDDPQGLGRIRAKLKSRPGEPVCQWAPVARPLASGGFGLFWQPVAGDMVVLGFEEGVIERPYVVGAIFTGDNTPPVTEVKQRVIRSESGHEIMLDDTEGSETIVITDKTGSTITMEASGVTIETQGDLTLKGTNVTIEASAQLTGKGNPIHLNP
ncbi:hypothetical protein RGUI_3684 [Rhodovulum sp. P5]|uniref:phage baseplate assembly protein V n=1 Tax=Rhodovulum sp. P5 TaxID=1564506 RepID=UPI0009C2CC95|nr:phage baseplate assembly protein V [Rhodovulum sp. P5]ARE41825.1 hypothetical protein RGUI_3684 [Rhodovulum sp. P5]